MDRGAWWATVHRVTESDRLSNKTTTTRVFIKNKYKNSGNTLNIISREMQIITTLKTIFTYQIGKIFLKCEILCLRLGLLPIAGWSWSTPMESNLIIRNDKIRCPWLSISNLRVAVSYRHPFTHVKWCRLLTAVFHGKHCLETTEMSIELGLIPCSRELRSWESWGQETEKKRWEHYTRQPRIKHLKL